MSEPEPTCWNCGALARDHQLQKDGPLWICRGCESEINAMIAQGKQDAILSEAAQDAQG